MPRMADYDNVKRERYCNLKGNLSGLRQEVAGRMSERLQRLRGASNDDVGDMADDSTSASEHNLEFGLLNQENGELQQIDQALKRLEEGTYGYCRECGEEIRENRLRAKPFAVRCKDCEEAAEDRSKSGKARMGEVRAPTFRALAG